MRKDNGFLIIFEGVDGCGKGTQIELTRKKLEAEHYANRVVKFPGQTPLGKELRRIMFENPETNTKTLAPGVTATLMLADHRNTLSKVVFPSLDQGEILICDRAQFSGLAYSVAQQKGGLFDEYVRNALTSLIEEVLERQAVVFFLTGNVKVFTERANARRTETHQAGKAWNDADALEQIDAEYYRIFRSYASREAFDCVTVIVNPHLTPEEVFEYHIWPALESRLRKLHCFF